MISMWPSLGCTTQIEREWPGSHLFPRFILLLRRDAGLVVDCSLEAAANLRLIRALQGILRTLGEMIPITVTILKTPRFWTSGCAVCLLSAGRICTRTTGCWLCEGLLRASGVARLAQGGMMVARGGTAASAASSSCAAARSALLTSYENGFHTSEYGDNLGLGYGYRHQCSGGQSVQPSDDLGCIMRLQQQ